MSDIERIKSALECIPAIDRDVWLKVGMAIKSELGDAEGWPVWNEWSKTAENYNEPDARAVWRSINPYGGVTIRTLYAMARANGWRPKEEPDGDLGMSSSRSTI